MSVDQVFSSYLSVLYNQWMWDLSIFSNELWMYYWLCIPALFFWIFVMIKWVFLTLPVWMPLSISINALKGIVNSFKR